MSWSKLHGGAHRHRKVLRLEAALGISDLEARGLALTLWSWTIETEPDGDLSDYHPEELARALGWRGDANALVNTLVDVGLLDRVDDGLHVHDWMEYAEGWKDARRKRADRRKKRLAKRPENVQDDPRRVQDCPGTVQRTARERRGEERRRDIDPPTPLTGGVDGGPDGVTADLAPSTQLVLAPPPPAAVDEPTVADVVEAWNRGREGSPIPRLQRPHRGTEARDRQIRDAMKRHPTPSAWEWCARALAASSHHRGENDRGWVADLEFVVGRGKGSTLDRWIEAGERLRTGEAQPPALRTSGRRLTSAEAMIAETRAHLAQRAQALLADVEPRETYDYEAIDITGDSP